jgi:hypothetical protein
MKEELEPRTRRCLPRRIRPLADLMSEVSAFASATARQVMFDVNFGFRNQEARKAGRELLVAEDFIERLYSSGLNVSHRLCPEMIEPSRLCVGVNLAIPGVVEIDLGQALEELGLVWLRQFLHRVDDFTHRAHASNLAETFPMRSGKKG